MQQQGILKQVKDQIRTVMASFDNLRLEEQAAMLTLPLLMLYVQAKWYVDIPVVTLCITGLIFSAIRRSAFLWFALACFMGAGIYFSWEISDNHKYAICYWCMAIFFIKWLNAGEDQLRISARLLLALIFAFATGWKLVSKDFMSGDFFQHAFIFDDRFSSKLLLFGWLNPQLLEQNIIAQKALINYDSNLTSVNIMLPERWRTLAIGLAWWTIILEGLIAICFFLPQKMRIAKVGDYLLMIFITSTYMIAPVIGFGWLLVIMGIMQCSPNRKKTRWCYLLVLLLVQLFRLPWADVADSFS